MNFGNGTGCLAGWLSCGILVGGGMHVEGRFLGGGRCLGIGGVIELAEFVLVVEARSLDWFLNRCRCFICSFCFNSFCLSACFVSGDGDWDAVGGVVDSL